MFSKRKIHVLAVLIFSLCCAAAAAACSDSGKKEIKMDAPASLTAEYNTVFTLPFVFAEYGGAEYMAQVSLKDAQGQNVPLYDGSFFVDKTDNYTAAYFVEIEGIRAEKQTTIEITGGDAPDALRLEGQLRFWAEPGEFDFSSLTYSLINASGQASDKTGAGFSVSDKNGGSVALSDQKATLDLGVYYVTVAKDGAVIYGAFTIFVSHINTDPIGEYIYADFGALLWGQGWPGTKDVNEMSLFSTDFPLQTDDFGKNTIAKYWTVRKAVLNIMFTSNGFADFAGGGRVTMTATVPDAGRSYKCVWYAPDGSPGVQIADFSELPGYAARSFSFDIPAGGTLEGGRIEIIQPDGNYNWYLNRVTVEARGTVEGELLKIASPGTPVDLAALDLTYTSFLGQPATGTKTFHVYDGATGVRAASNVTSFTPGASIYRVVALLNGQPYKNDISLNTYPKFDLTDSYVYASFASADDLLDINMFALDFEGTVDDRWASGGATEHSGVFGILKPVEAGFKWSYTFLTDGHADFSRGGTVKFRDRNMDDQLSVWGRDNFPFKVKVTAADGTVWLDADGVGRPYSTDEFTFYVPAGGTLVGAKIEFTDIDRSHPHILVDVVISQNLFLSGGTRQTVAMGEQTLSAFTAGMSLKDLSADTGVSGEVEYLVLNGSKIMPVTDGKFLALRGETYTIRGYLDGKVLQGHTKAVCNAFVLVTERNTAVTFSEILSGLNTALPVTVKSVKTSAGTPVDTTGNQFITARSEDTVYFVTIETSGYDFTAYVIAQAKKTDSDGNYEYAVFDSTADLAGTYLFGMDFKHAGLLDAKGTLAEVEKATGSIAYPFIGISKPASAGAEWAYTFLTDGHADFTHGGIVSFRVQLGQYVDSISITVKATLADGTVALNKTQNNNNYAEPNLFSFEIPVGGTLVGARVEVSHSGTPRRFAFGDVRINEGPAYLVGAGASVEVTAGEELTLAEIIERARFVNFNGGAMTGTVTAKVFAGSNEVDTTGGSFTPTNIPYTVVFYLNGKEVNGTVTLVGVASIRPNGASAFVVPSGTVTFANVASWLSWTETPDSFTVKSVKNAATDASVSTTNDQFTAADGTAYRVTVTVNGLFDYEIFVVCQAKTTDSDGNYEYAVFDSTSDVAGIYLFGTDFEHGGLQNGHSDTTGSVSYPFIGIVKPDSAGAEWSYTFLTDGYADFTDGGIVSFRVQLGQFVGGGVSITVKVTLADGTVVLNKTQNNNNYSEPNLFSFEIPADGTLVGARIEVSHGGPARRFIFGDVRIAEGLE
jgi:hypothetical protein